MNEVTDKFHIPREMLTKQELSKSSNTANVMRITGKRGHVNKKILWKSILLASAFGHRLFQAWIVVEGVTTSGSMISRCRCSGIGATTAG
jgi:hypothetical protein